MMTEVVMLKLNVLKIKKEKENSKFYFINAKNILPFSFKNYDWSVYACHTTDYYCDNLLPSYINNNIGNIQFERE